MDPLIIPVVAIVMPLILVPTILVMKYRHERRQWEHLERLKSIDFHAPISTRRAAGRAGGVAAIGAGVPCVSVLGALITTLNYEPSLVGDPAAVPGIAWGCAAIISVGAMVTSLKMASMHYRFLRESDVASGMTEGKVVYDPDAFDVVSSRG